MNNPLNPDTTAILQEWNSGDEDAPGRLMPLVYAELQRRAAEYLRRERPDHTLQPTALVHEAYLKLIAQNQTDWKSRAHFCGVVARLMRRVLLEHARGHHAEKRGGKCVRLSLEDAPELAQEQAVDLAMLDDALQTFTATYPREGFVVELKFFGGLEASEIAETLGVSEKTVLRDWSFAKLWLRRALAETQA